MALALPSTNAQRDPAAVARLHAVLRFGTGLTLAFVICEAMGWLPSFLAPLLLGALLTNLPSAPPLKAGLMLVAVMAAAALVAFMLPSLLLETPGVMVGAIGVVLFFGFALIAQGRAKLPALLLLICMAPIPVIVMVAPAQAGIMPLAMTRAMAIAVLLAWCMYALWPQVLPPAARPVPAPIASPAMTALMGTAVVLPLMFVYLLFGIADALPVLITTILLVTNFDPRQGARQGLAMMLGNLIGGLIGLLAYLLLSIAPSLITLALITFLFASAFAVRIGKGGPGAAVASITCNTTLIILSIALATGSGGWLTRLLQFALACLFAIGMMSIVWGKKPQPATSL